MADSSSLSAAITRIVSGGDLDQLSVKSIRKELEAEFGVDLTEQKEFIKAEIDRAVNSLAAKDEPEDSEEEETHEETADSKRKRPSSTGSGGFRQPQHLSAAMADFMGKPSAARTEVVSAISAYVKTNSLQNPSDGREIICDAKLKALLGQERVTYFTIQKFLQSHFLGKDENAEPLPPKNPSQPRKKAKKEKKERVAGEPNPRSPFCRPMKLSEALSKLTGASCLGRPQVTKRVWQYIRTHNAQNPADKREIVCDEAMRAVFKCERLNMMQMATAFKDHMTVITDADELELAWQEQERLQAESAPAPAGDLLGGGSALDDVGQFFKIEGNLDDA